MHGKRISIADKEDRPVGGGGPHDDE